VVKKLPIKVSEKHFNQQPYLRKPVHGPKPTVSSYKIFNYILFVLHTGMQLEAIENLQK